MSQLTELCDKAVDIVEVLAAVGILVGYGYFALVEGQRIDDPVVEAIVIATAVVMLTDQTFDDVLDFIPLP